MTISRRLVAATAVAVAALALVGCTRPIPAGPTDAEVAAYGQLMLDKTWTNTGLDQRMSRPVLSATEVLWEDDANWSKAVIACLADAGLTDLGFSWSFGDGYSLSGDVNGGVPSDDAQLAFYICVAFNPLALAESTPTIGRAELDFSYDYFRDWVVPCLASVGHSVESAPTREQFGESYGRWTPFWSLTAALSDPEYDQLVDECGPAFPLEN